MWYHTNSMCPLLVTFNSRLALRVDFLGLRKMDSLTRTTTCSETDGRPECPFLWSQMHPLSMKFLCHFEMDLLVDGSTLNLRLKTRCTVTALFVSWNSSMHQSRCCEVSAILHFTALWQRAGKLKISWFNVSAVHIYKIIPVSFDFITTWNQGVFLCSPCILVFCCTGYLHGVHCVDPSFAGCDDVYLGESLPLFQKKTLPL